MNKLILGVLVIFLSLGKLNAQVSNQKIQALFIYNFAKNIKWPNEKSSYVIGVLGDKEFYNELNGALKEKQANGKSFEIKLISSLAEAKDLNIIYLSASKSKELPNALAILGDKETLIITENDLSDKGAGISFLVVEDKLKFKINQNAITKNGLQVSGGLVSLAMR